MLCTLNSHFTFSVPPLIPPTFFIALTCFSCLFIYIFSAGALAAGLTNPLDVAKTRLQTQSDTGIYYRGMLDALRRIKQAEGWLGFTRGIVPRMIFFSMAAGIQFGSYEYVKCVPPSTFPTPHLQSHFLTLLPSTSSFLCLNSPLLTSPQLILIIRHVFNAEKYEKTDSN